MRNQITIPSDMLWSDLCMNMSLHVQRFDWWSDVTPLQRKRQSNIRVCAIFILSVWVLLHVFRGHIPRLGVEILSFTVSHTELTGGPLFRLQAAGDPDSAQQPLRDLPAFFGRTTPSTPHLQRLSLHCNTRNHSGLWVSSFYKCLLLTTSLWLARFHTDSDLFQGVLVIWNNMSDWFYSYKWGVTTVGSADCGVHLFLHFTKKKKKVDLLVI